MLKQVLSFIVLICCAGLIYAARPTVHAGNFYSSDYECTKLTLNWTNGNGSARLIIAREGSLPSYTPQDGAVYMPDPNFGSSIEYGNSNYIVYNGNGSSNVVITGLTRGKTYYFIIYEHDNNGSSTEYLTSGAPTHSATTYDVLLDFNIWVNDSCEKSNNFTFINNSSSTVPGISYLFDFGNGTSTQGMVSHKMSGNGMRPVILKAISGISNCPSQIVKNVKIFPKKHVNLDLTSIKDTFQCFDGNYFEANTTPVLAPFPMGVTYAWHTGDSLIWQFSKLRKNYQLSGRFRVMLITNATSRNMPTACFDTMYFTIAVKPDPRKNLKINSDTQFIDNNLFRFENFDTAIAAQTWYFGDGDSSDADSCSHSYADTGNYTLRVKVRTKDGCTGEKSYFLRVFDTAVASGIHHLQLNKMNLYPNPSTGIIHLQLKNPQAGDVLQVTDIQERVVKTFEANSRELTIDLSDHVTGVYLLQLLHKGVVRGYSLLIME